MADVVLPLDRFTADTYLNALENLVDRYSAEEEPIHYKKAAIGMNEATSSSCLRFFSDIGLIEAEKAGVYEPNEATIRFFRKIGKAQERAKSDIGQIFDKYGVYKETRFLAQKEEFDLEELSTEVAGHLGVDKDDVGQVKRAIEIFGEFGFLMIYDDGIVAIEDESNHTEEKTQETTAGNDVEEVSVLENNQKEKLLEELELPPTGGGPEKLLKVIEVLSDGGSHPLDDVVENVELSKRSVNGVIRYGKELQFIQEADTGYILTESGYELTFASSSSEKEELFYDAIGRSQVYCALLDSVLDAYKSKDSDKAWLDQPTALKEMRTTLGFTDSKESTLKSAVNTFFQTISAAGIGEYVPGRGNNPTRLEISDNEISDLEGILITVPAAGSSQENSRQESTSPEENESTEQETTQSGTSDQESSQEDAKIEQGRGPALKISTVRIENFRNIRDTGFFDLENVTTLIGKNESGKTSTLEAIESFTEDGAYGDRDLHNQISQSEVDGKIPVITLVFEVNQKSAEIFYPDLPNDVEFPLTVKRTKYSDGSYSSQCEGQLEEQDVKLPSPDILYYKDYSLISDKVSLEDIKDGEYETFKNLLDIGGLKLDVLSNEDEITRYNAIEDAENEIESKLNSAWSQKSLNIKIRWDQNQQILHLLIQDRLDPDSVDTERPLTYPSQRSEGFQWFFSFYINLLAESDSAEEESKILLLDDPAVYLHPEGKQDWLESVNEIGKQEQVVFSSHSPYLIDKRYPSRIRAVEDTPNGGTKINQDIFGSDEQTLEPLRNALGINLGSSPFISRRQILVEGPTEYYVISAVANYFTEVLDRDLFGWGEVSIMPVRGASDVVGKASWLASEGIEYAILLDSDEEGRDVKERIEDHHEDIDSDRIVLLENESNVENVVTEDLTSPELYIPAFNEEYLDYTSELEEEFQPAEVEMLDGTSWEVGEIDYEGTRLDKLLVEYLGTQPVSEHLENSNGEIELRKRQIAERVASRLNQSTVDEDQLSTFNRLFARIGSAIDST